MGPSVAVAAEVGAAGRGVIRGPSIPMGAAAALLVGAPRGAADTAARKGASKDAVRGMRRTSPAAPMTAPPRTGEGLGSCTTAASSPLRSAASSAADAVKGDGSSTGRIRGEVDLPWIRGGCCCTQAVAAAAGACQPYTNATVDTKAGSRVLRRQPFCWIDDTNDHTGLDALAMLL